MKHLWLLILLVLLGSCARNPHRDNHISVTFHNGSHEEYVLLSARQHELVVAPIASPKDSLLAQAGSIPSNEIASVHYSRGPIPQDAAKGIVPGLMIGLFVAILIYIPFLYGGLSAWYGIAALAGGLSLGTFLGYGGSKIDETLNPSEFQDYIKLSRYAVYPVNEPPELFNVTPSLK